MTKIPEQLGNSDDVTWQDGKQTKGIRGSIFSIFSSTHNYYTQQKQTENRSGWKSFKRIVSGFVSFATLFFVGCYTVITYWQYNLTQDQFKKQNKDLADSARQTQDALTAANLSAAAAARQAVIARETEIETLRPYISILLADIPRLDDKFNVHIRRQFTNTGKSVALDVQRIIQFDIIAGSIPGNGDGLAYPTDEQIISTPDIAFIAPGREQNASTDAVGQPFDPMLWNRLTSTVSDLTFVEWGTIRYKDVFGNVHHLWICHFWRGVGQDVANCQRGNRMN